MNKLTPEQIIDRLPYELQSILLSDEYLSGIPVIVADDENITAEMQRKTAVVTESKGKRGLAIIVLQLVADDDYSEVPFGAMTFKPAIQVVENVELNNDEFGFKISGRQVCRRIRDVIKSTGLTGLVSDIYPDTPCFHPVPLGNDFAGMRAYQVNFICDEEDFQGPTQAACPLFESDDTGANPVVKITCSTSNVSIYYTLDDSVPVPDGTVENSTSVLYTEPIVIPAGGLLLRARAYAPGMIASRINRGSVTLE